MIRPILEHLFKIRDEKDSEKPFLEHLEDLRLMLFKIFLVLGAAMTFAFFYRGAITQIIQRPLLAVDPATAGNLQSLAPADSITISFKLAFYAGLVIAFPVILYFILEFVLPGLTRKEQKMLLPAIGIGAGLFLLGVLFCYHWVLPMTLNFFFEDAKSLGWHPTWTVQEYFSFVTQFILSFGICFELPVVVMFLVKIDLLTSELMKRTRTYAVVIIFILAAAITPTTDVLTLVAMAGPMLVLYEGSIWVAGLVERKRNPA